jgi:hypothetical protein
MRPSVLRSPAPVPARVVFSGGKRASARRIPTRGGRRCGGQIAARREARRRVHVKGRLGCSVTASRGARTEIRARCEPPAACPQLPAQNLRERNVGRAWGSRSNAAPNPSHQGESQISIGIDGLKVTHGDREPALGDRAHGAPPAASARCSICSVHRGLMPCAMKVAPAAVLGLGHGHIHPSSCDGTYFPVRRVLRLCEMPWYG